MLPASLKLILALAVPVTLNVTEAPLHIVAVPETVATGKGITVTTAESVPG